MQKKNWWINSTSLLLLIGIALVLGGTHCKTKPKRKTLKIDAGPATDSNPVASADSLYLAILKNNNLCEWYSAKASVEISSKKQKQSFTATIRLRKDSAIWVSITPALGIEAIRVLLTRDSVSYFDRIHNQYFTGDYNIVKQTLKIEAGYQLIQALILGNSYLHYPPDLYGSALENGYWMLSTRKKRQIKRNTELPVPEILFQEIFFNPTTNKIARTYLQDYRPIRRFDVGYSGFLDVEGTAVPTTVSVKASAEDDVEIYMELSKIVLNKPLNLPYKIPEGYERKF